MLLMIDQLQVGLTASHRGPQTRASAGDSGSWRLTADRSSPAKSGYRCGYRDGSTSWLQRRPVSPRSEVQSNRCRQVELARSRTGHTDDARRSVERQAHRL